MSRQQSDAQPDLSDLIETVPRTKQREALVAILGYNNACQVWIGGSENHRFEYPYRLVPADRVTDRHRAGATQLMLDSAINNPSVTNETIIDRANQYNAQVVVPKDYLGQPDRTQESIEAFLDLYDEKHCEAEVLFPLQRPHEDHYRRYQDFWDSRSRIAIGGIRDADPATQLEAIRTVRDLVGTHTWLHGLGLGCSDELITAINSEHRLLQSLDTSTFERLPGMNKVADATWTQQQFTMSTGDRRSDINARSIELMVYQLVHQLSSLSDDSRPTTDVAQQTLTQDWSTHASTNTSMVDPADESDSDVDAQSEPEDDTAERDTTEHDTTERDTTDGGSDITRYV